MPLLSIGGQGRLLGKNQRRIERIAPEIRTVECHSPGNAVRYCKAEYDRFTFFQGIQR